MPKDRWGFDRWAASYDEDIIRSARAGDWIFSDYDRVLDKVVEYCGQEESSYTSVLDVGIGTGNLAARFLPRGVQVFGIDPSVKMRKICRKKYPGIKVTAGDFLNIPKTVPIADIIVSAYAFHHLNAVEKAAAVSVMKSHLKPKGRIVIADLMFQDASMVSKIKQELRDIGRFDILEEFADEYPALFDELGILFQSEGFCFDGERLTESVWILRACL